MRLSLNSHGYIPTEVGDYDDMETDNQGTGYDCTCISNSSKGYSHTEIGGNTRK